MPRTLLIKLREMVPLHPTLRVISHLPPHVQIEQLILLNHLIAMCVVSIGARSVTLHIIILRAALAVIFDSLLDLHDLPGVNSIGCFLWVALGVTYLIRGGVLVVVRH